MLLSVKGEKHNTTTDVVGWGGDIPDTHDSLPPHSIETEPSCDKHWNKVFKRNYSKVKVFDATYDFVSNLRV